MVYERSLSDTLLIWASASKTKLLLWPWIVLHCLEFVFFLAALIFLMVKVPDAWFKVVIFLVGCPLLVLMAFFWVVVQQLYSYLRDLGLKSAVAAVYQNGYKVRKWSAAFLTFLNFPGLFACSYFGTYPVEKSKQMLLSRPFFNNFFH